MRVSYLVLRYLADFSWRLLNAIYSLAQRLIIWQLTGTAYQLRQIDERLKTPGNQLNGHPTAQALRIVGRFKLDSYMQPAQLSDFLVVHDRFETAEHLLRDNVTLYAVSKKEAIFVETKPEIDVWRASVSPFVMSAQFNHAVRVFRLPLAAFHQLAEHIGHPRGQLVFIGNTARCGSTLLTQMFEMTNKIISISEPSSLNVLAGTVEKGRSADVNHLIVSTIRVLCKPTSLNELAHVIKLTAPSLQSLGVLAELFPDARSLFMYRDSLKVAQSLYRLSEELPTLKTIFVVGKGSARRLGMCVEVLGMPKNDYNFNIKHDLSIGAMLWAASLKKYFHFRDAGIDIVAVRYEDIAADPERAMRRILSHCRLPEKLAEHAKKALGLDSQRSTPFAGHILSRHRVIDYDGAAKVECDAIMDSLASPRLGAKYIAPGTITAD